MRLVLDSNVVLALWLFEDPALQALRDAVEAGRFALLSRDDALTELALVLAYPQFAADAARREAILQRYRNLLHCLPVADSALADELAKLPLCADEDDQKFLEIAWQGEAAVLLTRDRQLLKSGRRRIYRERFLSLRPEDFIRQQLLPDETAT